MKDIVFFDDNFLDLLNEYMKCSLFGIFTNKKRIDKQNKVEYKLFETLEKKIARDYSIQEILKSKEIDEKYKNIIDNISYNKYIEMLGETYVNKEINYMQDENQEQLEDSEILFENYMDIPGDEKDYVDGYEEFLENKDIEYDNVDLKYIAEFKRKDNIAELVSYEEYCIKTSKGKNYYDKYNYYVIIVNIKNSNRLHICTNIKSLKNDFENRFYDYKETIESNTYEISPKFEKLSEQDKKFLIEIYEEYGLEFSVVLKENRLYIQVKVLVSKSLNKNIPNYFSIERLDKEYQKLEKCIKELFEYFLNKFELSEGENK